jgi:hypothetical protein
MLHKLNLVSKYSLSDRSPYFRPRELAYSNQLFLVIDIYPCHLRLIQLLNSPLGHCCAIMILDI